MNILVIDDNRANLDAAAAQLREHKLTLAGSYDEAHTMLGYRGSYSRVWDSVPPSYDVVLVDLLLPASAQEQAKRTHVGLEMPIGIFLALLAAKKGAKKVAVFTDTDHHSHPASACMDPFNPHETVPESFKVCEADVFLSNTRNWVRDFEPQNLGSPLEYRTASDYRDQGKPIVRAKHWAELLEYIMAH
jgi:CheY-like chemotaxis protein